MGIEKLLNGVNVVAVVCNQWGDTGKGKFSDYFSEWADVIARGTGGNNAGHTVVINDKERIFHLIPAGITYDSDGKINILGNGLGIDLKVLCGELKELDNERLTYNNLMISKDAHVIMPYHVDEDIAKNKSQTNGGVGSTGRGIGPCYRDKIDRKGITVGDLFESKDAFVAKIKKAKSDINSADLEKCLQYVNEYSNILKPFVRDTVNEMHEFRRRGKRILLEGAQGLLLSIEHGTYPYETSSDCSVNGTASGVGISARAIDLVLGIVKFPFMTRVGGGPFPTELGGEDSEKYCADDTHRREFELNACNIPYEIVEGKIKYNSRDFRILQLLNSTNPFTKGVGIRLAANEFGATTGRARRVGWTDAVLGKYAVGINGPMKLILTKVDSLLGMPHFNVCYDYRSVRDSKRFSTYDFSKDADFLRDVRPRYKSYQGYSEIGDAKNYDELPSSLKDAIEDYEKFVGAEAAIVSVGADRNQTIVR